MLSEWEDNDLFSAYLVLQKKRKERQRGQWIKDSIENSN